MALDVTAETVCSPAEDEADRVWLICEVSDEVVESDLDSLLLVGPLLVEKAAVVVEEAWLADATWAVSVLTLTPVELVET